MERGLTATQERWPAIRTAYGFVHRAAHVLSHPEGRCVEEIRREYRLLLGEMSRGRNSVGPLGPAVDHFLKVSQSYWRGLFACYETPQLPRTNNDLEQLFGSARHQERRTTGRKGASPSLVVRGAVRLVASVVTRLCPLGGAQLRPHDLLALGELRRELNERHEARRAQSRFRRDPAAYLAAVEQQLIGSGLPS